MEPLQSKEARKKSAVILDQPVVGRGDMWEFWPMKAKGLGLGAMGFWRVFGNWVKENVPRYDLFWRF